MDDEALAARGVGGGGESFNKRKERKDNLRV